MCCRTYGSPCIYILITKVMQGCIIFDSYGPVMGVKGNIPNFAGDRTMHHPV